MAQNENNDNVRFLAKLRQGDPASFREWVRQTRPLAEAVALAIVGDADVVEDLVQQAYIQAFAKLASVRDPERLQAWLVQIVRNQARDWLRRRAVKKREYDRYAQDFAKSWDEPRTSEDPYAARRERLRELVGELPPDLREVVLLRYYSGKSYEEIARVIGAPVTTVDGRMRLAKRRLEELLSQDHD